MKELDPNLTRLLKDTKQEGQGVHGVEDRSIARTSHQGGLITEDHIFYLTPSRPIFPFFSFLFIFLFLFFLVSLQYTFSFFLSAPQEHHWFANIS